LFEYIELCRAFGGNCGGTSVDNALYQIFAKLVAIGAPLLNAMKKDIFREFEAIKKPLLQIQKTE
jgi:hypothetical protein